MEGSVSGMWVAKKIGKLAIKGLTIQDKIIQKLGLGFFVH